MLPLMNVTENLQTGFACLGRGARSVPDRIYDLFSVLAQARIRRGGDLSGAQQQQPAIARALATCPRVLLLDEPTEGIQRSIIKEIGRVISTLRDEGEIAIVLVEQYFDFAVGLADRVTVLTGGQVSYSATRGEIEGTSLLEAVSL